MKVVGVDIDYDRVATRSFLSLLLVGATVFVLVATGLISTWREVKEGFHHFYNTCLLLLQRFPYAVSMIAPLALLLAFLTIGVWVASITRGVWKSVQFSRRLDLARVPLTPELGELAASLGLSGRLFLIDGHEPIALTTGFLRPAVFLTQGLMELLEKRELEAILRHELYHVQRRDPFKILLGSATRRVLFFLPAAADLWNRYLTASELAADISAVATQRVEALGSALLKVLRRSQDPSQGMFIAQLQSILDLRLVHLLRPETASMPTMRWRRLVGSVLVLLMLGLFPLSNGSTLVEAVSYLGIACSA